MTDREVMKLALEALQNNRYIIESEINPPEALEEVDVAIAALRQAIDHVPDTTKMTEPDMGIDRGAWDDVPDATKWVDELRGGDETEQEHESRITSLEIRVAKLEKPMTEHEKQLMAGQRSLLRTAPPKQPEQEPVAYITGEYKGYFTIEQTNKSFVLTQGMNLYTAPPKREWQYLTDEEIMVCGGMDGADTWVFEFAYAIEAKLKEKNT